jgi:hypothetical protein
MPAVIACHRTSFNPTRRCPPPPRSRIRHARLLEELFAERDVVARVVVVGALARRFVRALARQDEREVGQRPRRRAVVKLVVVLHACRAGGRRKVPWRKASGRRVWRPVAIVGVKRSAGGRGVFGRDHIAGPRHANETPTMRRDDDDDNRTMTRPRDNDEPTTPRRTR